MFNATTKGKQMETFYVEADGAEMQDFDCYADAVNYANQMADELVDRGFDADRSWASRRNMYAIRCTLGNKIVDIQVNDDE
jgi:hypothetical protein